MNENFNASASDANDVFHREVERVINNSASYGAISYARGSNAIVDISHAYKNGDIHLAAADVNREHGIDEKKTGESIMKYGMQHHILVITYKMANAASIKVRHFKNDPDKAHEWNENDLVLLDGHGRIDYLLSMDKDTWPQVYAYFPSPDSKGNYDLPKIMTEININVSKWATKDLVQKRRLEDGDKGHPGWAYIDTLIKNGYKYQAACQAVTLETDRIKSSQINGGEVTKIFGNYDSAIKIHEALVDKFDEKILMTKLFPGAISSIWQNLRNQKGVDFATERVLEFINGISADSIKGINASKEDSRVMLLEAAFAAYEKKDPKIS